MILDGLYKETSKVLIIKLPPSPFQHQKSALKQENNAL